MSLNGRPAKIGIAMDITERKAAEEVIRKLAFYDRMTGLPNRRMMEDRLGQLIALAKREERKLSLLFIDLDKFKAVNDQHGHEAGDWLLAQVASRMRSVLRESDTASRIGGDEFVILLPDAGNAEDAVVVAEKIRLILEQPFVMDNGVTLFISSSIGVVIYPDLADNLRDLLRYGDEAMYRAKRGGRNAVEVFTLLQLTEN
jgi:diguanylate cyclase (GGDEF)-like protein